MMKLRYALVLLLASCAACTGPTEDVAVTGDPVVEEVVVETTATTSSTTTTTTTTTTHYHPPTTTTAPPAQAVSSGSVWDDLADCESGQRDKAGNPIPGTANWSISTGNGYYGGLQFSLSSWEAVGGTGYPHHHSRETQIEMGRRLQNTPGGWGHWPDCSRKLGLR